jgi:hypothetical protein
VTAASEWGATEPLIAAARLGQGRVVVFGYTAIFEGGVLQVADTARLTGNILRWTAGDKSAPRVGVYKIDRLARQFTALGIQARDITLHDLDSVDVVMALARFFTLQRVGLIPDIEAYPSIEGIRAGRDEILERALEYLEKGR